MIEECGYYMLDNMAMTNIINIVFLQNASPQTGNIFSTKLDGLVLDYYRRFFKAEIVVE